MKFRPGDWVIVNHHDRFGNFAQRSGVVKSRNFWVAWVEFHDCCIPVYEHQMRHLLRGNGEIMKEENKEQLDQWDESLRGKKMSDNKGKVIYKYQMPVKEQFSLKLPQGAEIIRVADQDGMFWLWAVVNTDVPDEERHFVAVKCGGNVPEDRNLRYVGMCAIFVQQELALYIFEETEK